MYIAITVKSGLATSLLLWCGNKMNQQFNSFSYKSKQANSESNNIIYSYVCNNVDLYNDPALYI